MPSKNAAASIYESQQLILNGDFEAAKLLLLKGFSHNPDDGALRRELTLVYSAKAQDQITKGQSSLALINLTAALNLSPDDLSLHALLLQLFTKRLDPTRALPPIVRLLNSGDSAFEEQAHQSLRSITMNCESQGREDEIYTLLIGLIAETTPTLELKKTILESSDQAFNPDYFYQSGQLVGAFRALVWLFWATKGLEEIEDIHEFIAGAFDEAITQTEKASSLDPVSKLFKTTVFYTQQSEVNTSIVRDALNHLIEHHNRFPNEDPMSRWRCVMDSLEGATDNKTPLTDALKACYPQVLECGNEIKRQGFYVSLAEISNNLLLKIDPTCKDANALAACAYKQYRRYDLALELWPSIWRGRTTDLSAYLEKIDNLRAMGEVQAAIEIGREATSNHPNKSKVWNDLGELHFEDQNIDEALHCFRKAESIDNALPENSIAMGRCLKLKGETHQAAKHIAQGAQRALRCPAPVLYLEAYPKWQEKIQELNSNATSRTNLLTERQLLVQHFHTSGVGHNSMTEAISRLFKPWQTYFTTYDTSANDTRADFYRAMTQKQRDGLSFLHDHSQVLSHTDLPDKVWRFVMLRNPVALYLSQRYWPNRHNISPQDFIAPSGELYQGIRDRIKDKQAHDGVIRELRQSLPPLDSDPANQPEKNTIASESISRHFNMVGITELFCESLFLVTTLTELGRVPFWKHGTASGGPKPHHLLDETRNNIFSITRGEQRLYDQSREKLLDEHGPLIEFFKKEIKSLEDSNAPNLTH